MTGRFNRTNLLRIYLAALSVTALVFSGTKVMAKDESALKTGGGYAVSRQTDKVGYSAQIYDAENGLITSDANCILGASDGSIWVGGYSGILRYDGSTFEKLDTADGLTSGRGIFEDSRQRIFVGTNDNGVVVIDGEERIHYTYKEGLPSSSIRVFAEDNNGNVFIGTTSGIAYISPDGALRVLDDARINEERILKLEADTNGRIYGQTKNGVIFAIDNCEVTEFYDYEELGMEKITCILADPNNPGMVYITTSGSAIYYGQFGARYMNMKRISILPLENIHWISYDCDRVWVSTTEAIGYLDNQKHFHEVKNLPMNSSIEMTTSDYQGNLWAASSTQGIMKVVTNNFEDLFELADIRKLVTNATCLHKDKLYVGTDWGLFIIDKNNEAITNKVTNYFKDTRIRCLMEDSKNNLWVSTYTGGKGLVCVNSAGEITAYTAYNGLPHNEVRATYEAADGSILVATNGGLAVIQNGKIVKCVCSEDGIKNTIFLSVIKDADGKIYVGTDGDGIYVIDGDKIDRIGRDDGLTSDVIMKIKEDKKRGLYWLVTSNSIQYMKDGVIHEISTFPYNNNYDIYFDDNGYAWVLSACGIYKIKADDMLRDSVTDYRLYTIENGLPYSITSNSRSAQDEDGNLYMSGRYGVIKVNTNDFLEESIDIKVAVNSVYCGDTKILPDDEGKYVIPPSGERIRIQASIMDYTMVNPMVRLYLEGRQDDGITKPRSEMFPLEYTYLPYGNYKLHIQVMSHNEEEIILDEAFDIIKKPRFTELFIFRMLFAILLSALVGFIVYKVMKATVVNRQYVEIKKARDEAERANSAKTRFLANISHEIRTPINTIMGMNEMVMREDATGVPKGYFMSMMNYAFDIKNAAESLLGLISDLLDMSKIESGKMHLVQEEYDVQDVLRAIVSMIRIRSTQKELTFDVVVDEMLPKRLYGDDGKIKQIVLNLLTNAVKYTNYGGFILNVTMVTREDNDCEINFVVKDTGIGIKEEDMERLFTAYERLDEEKNSGIQGTGLGLDISRRFAELMGGSLTCKSVYGEGSEFTFVVHQKIIDPTPLGIFVEHEEVVAAGPYVPKFVAPDADVLVVDDSPMNLNVIKGLLKATKVFVTTASSGAECLEKIAENNYHVVFLDHMMPEMDGIETLARIRVMKPDLPVYALTANASNSADFYIEKGFNGYLTKPVDCEALEKTIMKHIPEEMMEKADESDAIEDLKEIPEELSWIKDIPEISVDEGIKNSGGISSYIFSLQLFLDTIDGNARVIQDAYDSNNIRLYTIKVHALKSSARIIGATDLGKLAADLEDAGNHEDTGFIQANHDRFMADYLSFKDKLGRLVSESQESEDKEAISAAELQDAYDALKDVVPQMDYDAVEMIIGQLKTFALPEEDATKVAELEKMLRNFDWDGMEELIAK
ncbi:MAG: response regulator [Butyrivibrio sp.]|nr:response regulator [Butyrivibrio sp.]